MYLETIRRLREFLSESHMTTTIAVSRDRGYADRLRDYRVLLDGSEIGRIGNGGEKSFEFAAGRHLLMMKVDWGRSNILSFEVGADQSIQFRCGSSLRGWRLVLALYYATFGFRNYLWLRAE
jgi:hypothetical protein